MQHLIVIIIFAVCILLIIYRITQTISHAKKGAPHCNTCIEINCPLHQANVYSNNHCDYRGTKKNNHNLKKTQQDICQSKNK